MACTAQQAEPAKRTWFATFSCWLLGLLEQFAVEYQHFQGAFFVNHVSNRRDAVLQKKVRPETKKEKKLEFGHKYAELSIYVDAAGVLMRHVQLYRISP